MPTPLLNNATPMVKKCIKRFVIFILFVFLGVCVILQLSLLTKKMLDSRVVPSVFLGFKSNTKSFLFLNLKIDLSRNVIFFENSFPYHSKHIQNNYSSSLSLPIPQNYVQTHDDFHMHTESIDNSFSDNIFEIDTNV